MKEDLRTIESSKVKSIGIRIIVTRMLLIDQCMVYMTYDKRQ